MRRPAAALLLSLLVAGAPPARADHLVGAADVRRALLSSAGQRQRDLARLERVLAAAPAPSFSRALPALSDAELRDLAARAEALETDPRGTGAGKAVLIVALVALVVFAILFVDWAQSFE